MELCEVKCTILGHGGIGDYGGLGIGALALGAALGADEALLAGGGGFVPSVGWCAG